ncbi:MAG: hypothetical protein RL367_1544, partial [Pseudomonadota bacterium]
AKGAGVAAAGAATTGAAGAVTAGAWAIAASGVAASQVARNTDLILFIKPSDSCPGPRLSGPIARALCKPLGGPIGGTLACLNRFLPFFHQLVWQAFCA